MKKLLFFLAISFSSSLSSQNIDSLIGKLKTVPEDTTKLYLLMNLSEVIPDNSWQKYNELLGKLSIKLMLSSDQKIKQCATDKYAVYLSNMGFIAKDNGDIGLAIEYFNKCMKIQESYRDKDGIAHTLSELGVIYNNQGNIEKGLEYYEKSLKIREEMGDLKSAALVLSNIGTFYYQRGNIELALVYFNRSEKNYSQINDKKGLSNVYNAFAAIYYNKGDIPNSLLYYNKSLMIRENLKDKNGIAESLNNIGSVYYNQSDFEKCLEYLKKSLRYAQEASDKSKEALALNNIGNVYLEQKKYQLALDQHLKSLKIREDIEDATGIAQSLNNIGNLYNRMGDPKKGLSYFEMSLKRREEIADKYGMAQTLHNIGAIYRSLNDDKKAFEYSKKAFELSDQLGFPENIRDASEELSILYKKQHNYKDALEMYVQFIKMRDSINSKENKKASIKNQFKYEYDKKAAADSVRIAEEKKVTVLTLKQERTQRFALYVGLGLTIVFGGFMFNRFRVTRKQKNIISEQKNEVEFQKHEIEKQKELVEEHQKEIIDSINYAKRLQQAILPPTSLIDRYIPVNFVLYHPKDIVAGDFYWMEVVSSEKKDKNEIILIAAADSTGHGVPGAMVSIVCSNALDKAVKEFGLFDTGKILDKTTDLVLETFAKSGEEIKDGMDISLLCIDKQNRKISWSGANNQLWYIYDNTLIEVRADKQPVGKSDNRKPFTTHEIQYREGSVFYLMTDGYPDQFGGPKGKKYKYKQLSELILSSASLSLAEQKIILENSFENWKGELEQVDDVSIIGVRM